MKKNKVKASNFLAWYFSSSDDVDRIGERAFENLMSGGTFTITAEDLFDECGYIPQFICENNVGENDYVPFEVQFINDLK
jgi:hypothetical protein